MLGNEDKSKYSIEIAKRINIGEKSFFFLGAGASIDSALPEKLRLPDGNKIKRYLLDTMGWQEENIRMRKNIEEVTPEIVWGEIIEKSNREIGINILRSIFEYNEKEKNNHTKSFFLSFYSKIGAERFYNCFGNNEF